MSENISKEVLVRLKLDTTDLEKKAGASEIAIAKTSKELKEFQKQLNNKTLGAEHQQMLGIAIAKTKSELASEKSELAKVNKEIENNKKVVNEQLGSNNQLRSLLSSLTVELNAMSKGQREGSERGKFLTTTIRDLSDKLKENESAVGDNRRNVGNYAGALEETIAKLKSENVVLTQNTQVVQQAEKKGIGFNSVTKEGSVNIKGFTNSLTQSGQVFNSFTDIVEANTMAVSNNDAKIEELEREMIGFKANTKGASDGVKEYENNLGGLQKKLADLKQSLSTQTIGSEQFEKTNKAIKDTNFQINKVQGNVDEFGNKEPKNLVKKSYEDLGDTVAGVTGAIQISEIAFGKSSNTAAAQARVLQLVAIQQAAVNIAKGLGAIADLKASIAAKLFNKETGLMARGQAMFTSSLGKSRGALRLFKGALISTGIGAIVVLLGELIFNFGAVSKWINKATNGIKDWFSSISNGNKVVMGIVDVLLLVISPLVTIIRLIADFRGTFLGLKNSVNGAMSSMANMTKNIPVIGQLFGFMKMQVEGVINTFQALFKWMGLMGTPKYKADINGLKEIYANFNKEVESGQTGLKREIELLEAQGTSAKKVIELKKIILKQNADAANQALIQATIIRNKILLEHGQLTMEQKAAFKEIVDAALDSKNQIAILEAEQNKKASELGKERVAFEKDKIKEINELQNSQIKKEEERQIAEENERRRQEKEALDFEIKEVTKKFGLTEKLSNEFKKLSELQEVQHLQNIEKIQKDFFDRQVENLSEQQDIERENLENSIGFKIEQLLKEQQFENDFFESSQENTARNNKEKLQQEKELSIKRLELQRANLQAQLQLIKEAALKGDLIPSEAKTEIDIIIKKLNALGIKLKDIQEPKTLISKEFADMFSEGVDLAMQAVNALSDAINASFANQTALIDANTKKEIDGINKTAFTKLQKDELIKKAELKGAKEKYKLDVEAFNFNKAIRIAETTANLAQALIAIFAVPDPTSGVLSAIRAGIVAATGAVQIGIIASQQPPPPPFKQGGYTGDGNINDVSNSLGNKPYIYHKGEYVVPNNVLESSYGSMLVNELESMRSNRNSGLVGFADGGYTTSQMNNSVKSALEIQKLSNNIVKGISELQIITKVTDINRVNKNLKVAQIKSSL